MDKFNGYIRPDGSVGVRNHLLILPGTILANKVVEIVANNISGAVPVYHPLGRAQVKPDLRTTFNTLVGTGKNPNVGGVLVIDHFYEEGCSAEDIAEEIRKTGKPVEIVNIRKSKGVIEATSNALRKAMYLKREISKVERRPVDVSKLLFGLNCGTSDTTSGLGSNPALGFCSDRIVDQGGRSILAELTELMGAEDYILERSINKEVGNSIVDAISNFEKRALECGEDIRGSQPTGDNIIGGLSTIEEKSLGAYQKSGSAPIMGLIDYAEAPLDESGVYVMNTPGQGSESITGIAAAGAQVLVFSTGGGHVINHPIMPTIKVTSNSNSYELMKDSTELDLSDIFNNGMSIEHAGDLIYQEVLDTCNGKETKSEILKDGTGFAIHRTGISL